MSARTIGQLQELTDAMHADGRTVMLEVVSEAADAELRSIEAARTLGVDWILGGTHADEALAILAGSPARYCPFPGTIVGHPSLLRGTVESIAADAARLTALDGVLRAGPAGLPLRRGRGGSRGSDRGRVCRPGHRRRQRRLPGAHPRRWRGLGVWGYTIGGAIFEGKLPGGPGVADQVREVLGITAEADAAR